MSTQDDNLISLILTAESDRQQFRLLELPPELLAILTATHPPTLELKATGADDADAEDAGTAVLCTPDKTFSLRQKNSSNTVYLLQPHESLHDSIAPAELRAIAQCYSSLELTAHRTSAESNAANHMKGALPIFSSTGIASSSAINKRMLFDCTPFSEAECEQAYRELVTFAHPETGAVYRPSAALAVQVWRDVLNIALAQGIDISSKLSEGSLETVVSQNTPIETAIAGAILRALTTVDSDEGTVLDPDKVVSWLGATLLEAEAAQSEMSTKILLETWKDLLAESWRPLANIARISAISQTTDNGKSIMLKSSSTSTSTNAQTSSASSNTSAGTKRKWHEKFRPTKK